MRPPYNFEMDKKSWGDFCLKWSCGWCATEGSSAVKRGTHLCANCGKKMFGVQTSPVPPRAQIRLWHPGVKVEIVPVADSE